MCHSFLAFVEGLNESNSSTMCHSVVAWLGCVSWWLVSLCDPFGAKNDQGSCIFTCGSKNLSPLPQGGCRVCALCLRRSRVFWPTTLWSNLSSFTCFSSISALFAPRFWRKVLHMLLEDLELKLEALNFLSFREWGPSNVLIFALFWLQSSSYPLDFASLSLDIT